MEVAEVSVLRSLVRRWQANPAERVGLALLPLRLFLGVTFVVAALQKIADPVFFAPRTVAGSMANQIDVVSQGSPIQALLGPVQAHPMLFAVATSIVELLIGVAMLAGFLTRLAAFAALGLSVSLFLTVTWQTRPYYYGADILFAFAWTAFVLGGAPVWSVDAWRAARRARARAAGETPGAEWRADRRRVLVGVGALGVVATVAGVTAAVVGRRLGRNDRLAVPPPPAAVASGTVIARAVDVAVGSTLEFTNPATGRAAVLLRPAADTVLAYDRTCTHLGCLVTTPTAASGPISCGCHGSEFDAATGAVTAGPAPAPLTRIPVSVDGVGNVVLT
ncbi:MAG: DoxX family rane protein [Frankiales bacterium]|nr:DoxX family rane protein [Frankiales bacterium]